MKIVLYPDELRRACIEYISAHRPELRGKSVLVSFDELPLTADETTALDCGLRVSRHDWIKATIEVTP